MEREVCSSFGRSVGEAREKKNERKEWKRGEEEKKAPFTIYSSALEEEKRLAARSWHTHTLTAMGRRKEVEDVLAGEKGRF